MYKVEKNQRAEKNDGIEISQEWNKDENIKKEKKTFTCQGKVVHLALQPAV